MGANDHEYSGFAGILIFWLDCTPVSIMTDRDIPKYLEIGHRYKDWYKNCKQLFIELFGEEELELVCNLFAATSINTSLKSNIPLFRRAYYEYKENLPIGNYLPNIKRQLQQIRENKPLTGRKINSFAQAMSGNVNAVVVDIWALRAFGEDRKYTRHTGPHAGYERSGGASDRQYDLIEGYVREHAPEYGLLPYEMSAMIWAGARIHHNGETENTYEALLRFKLNNLFGCI